MKTTHLLSMKREIFQAQFSYSSALIISFKKIEDLKFWDV
jgi:hypothetical protein